MPSGCIQWIFDSKDVPTLVIQCGQAGIEGGGLTGTGWPGYKNNTVRAAKEF